MDTDSARGGPGQTPPTPTPGPLTLEHKKAPAFTSRSSEWKPVPYMQSQQGKAIQEERKEPAKASRLSSTGQEPLRGQSLHGQWQEGWQER